MQDLFHQPYHISSWHTHVKISPAKRRVLLEQSFSDSMCEDARCSRMLSFQISKVVQPTLRRSVQGLRKRNKETNNAIPTNTTTKPFLPKPKAAEHRDFSHLPARVPKLHWWCSVPNPGKGEEHLAVTETRCRWCTLQLCNLCTFQPRLERQDKRCCPGPLPHDAPRGFPVKHTAETHCRWMGRITPESPTFVMSELADVPLNLRPVSFILPIVTHPTVSMTQQKRIHTPGPVAPSPTTYHLPPHGTTMILPGDMLATSAATAAPHRFTLMQRYFGTKGEPHDGIPTEEELVFWRKNIWETTSALIFCFKITGSVLIGNRLGKEPARSIEEMAKRRALRTSQGCWPERFKKKLHVFLRRKVGNMFGWHRKYWKIPLRASFLRNRENPYEALAHPMTLGMLAPLLRSWISFRCYLILGGPVRDEELGIYVSNQPTTKT